MAESVVSLLLNKLASLTEEEVNLLRGVWGEVESIRNELECMRAFLRVADAEEESDQQLKLWVKQVRDVAYDTEDVLDEFMLHLACCDYGHGFYAYLCKISRAIKNLKTRHRVASEIQSIKSRVSNISEQHQRYAGQFNVGSTSITTNNTWDDRRGDALLLEEAELVGLEKPKKELIKWLVEGNSELKVVSVDGMGGMGKTTLVKKVYDDIEVKKHFDSHAWITVSQSFKIEELLKGIIRQLYAEIRQPAPHGVDTMDNPGLKSIVKEFLQQRMYVLILDDVWSIHAWEALKHALPNNNRGSRVMLTTRSADIACTSCKESNGNVYTLKPLSPEESWKLFCKKTFQANSCPQHLEELSQRILQRCEGLPLAIVVISGVLSVKDESRIDEWEIVHRSLGAELEGNEKLGSLKNILLLSYNDLPYYLKSCFLYFSIFPEDYLIERMRLIRLWIAEGFVEAKEGKTLEEVAESYLNELINRSLIQIAGKTRYETAKRCRIHDLLREIILSKSRDQNFVAIGSEQSTRWPDKIRRLSVHKTFGTVQLNKSTVSQLRSLLMFSLLSPSSIKVTLFSGHLRLLTVLDLHDAPLEIFPNEILKLYHLRYLSLRRTKLKMIPSSIGKLQNLETLDLKHAYVTELPVEILKLKRLRHLLLYRYEFSYPSVSICGFKPPEGMGDLLSLQKLCYIEANQSRGIMRELGRLNQLRRLGITKLRREDGMALCSSIEKMSNLRSLKVSSLIEGGEIIDLQWMSSPPTFLQQLSLEGRLEKLPHWIPSLHSLIKLGFFRSRLRDDPLEFLHALPNLVELRLVRAYDGEILCFKAGWFLRLKRLSIKMDGLKRVIVEEKAMPYLEELVISRCKLLEKVPSGIKFLKFLQLLEFSDMSDQFIEDLYYERRAEYLTSKIAHIPEVKLFNWEDSHWVTHPI